jgi:hypothetical protein
MQERIRKYVHREVDYKRLADKEKRRKKKEMPRSSWVIRPPNKPSWHHGELPDVQF